MMRAILEKLARLLRSRVGRAGSNHDDQQDTDEPKGGPTDKPEEEDPPREEHTPPDDDRPEKTQTEDGPRHENAEPDPVENHEQKPADEPSDDDLNRSSDESLDITWPPNPCVDTPHRGVGNSTIEIRLYWRDGDELGEWACKMAKPYVEYCYEDAWGTGYEVDCTIHPDAVPIDRDSRDHHGTWFGAFREYYWQLSSDDRAKHANAFIGHLPGVYGEGGGHYCVVNLHKLDGPADHYPWTEDDCIRERHYGGLGHSINSVLHEIGHCLGLSHADFEPGPEDLVEVYGREHVTVMNNSYHSGDGQIHVLGDRVRSKQPDLSY